MRKVIERAMGLGLNPENIVREILQKLILYSISYTDLDEYYIFQGGTALRLVYGSPRFSLDIDLTLVSRDIEKVLKDIRKIGNILAKTISIDHIDVEVSGETVFKREGFYRCFFIFDTREFLGRKIRIKIEVNKGRYSGIRFSKKIIDIEYPFKTSIGISVKNPHQLLADKVASLAGGIHRGIIRWRDIFDIYWLRKKLDAELDEDYFQQEFGSWIEEVEDLRKIIYKLRDILKREDYREASPEFQRILPPMLSKDELVKSYIMEALQALYEALKVVG